MAFFYKCTSCRTKIPFVAGKLPEFCPNPQCASRAASDRDDADIVIPFIRSAATKANDDLYRSMEKASEYRAEQAAQMAGTPVSEMSGLKITNLNETRHEGAIAAVQEVTPVTQFMAANPKVSGFQGNNGVEFSGAVQTGPHPNVGARMRTAVQANHRDMVSQHCVGKDETGRMVRPGLDVTSDRPANETMQPGYRRRG
jgi:hypothetical protein